MNGGFYESFRQFADSWGLVLSAAGFLLLVGWPFLPGQRTEIDKAAHSIFDEDEEHGE